MSRDSYFFYLIHWNMQRKERVAIIGAGIQGVCTALFLQNKGFNVTLFDRDEPGNAASYGNAGHFSPYASLQLNRTDVLSDVPSMLLSSRGPLALKWNYVPKMLPWFTKFIFNTTKSKMMHTAKYMHQILNLSLNAFDELFEDVDLDGLVVNNGIIYVWEKKGLKSRDLEINIRKELGIDQQILTPKEIHDLEPNIKKFYHGGVFYKSARHARNPKKILIKLFEKFISKGGKFLKLNINYLDFDDKKPVLRSDAQRFLYDKLIIACGAFSKRLTDQLHEKIPLDTERGYQVHFKNHEKLLSRPVVWSDRGCGVTPMDLVD